MNNSCLKVACNVVHHVCFLLCSGGGGGGGGGGSCLLNVPTGTLGCYKGVRHYI